MTLHPRKGARYRSRLRLSDLLGSGTIGVRTRLGRVALTAIGIAIGIASLTAIVGISEAGHNDARAEIDALGTDLLLVQPGVSIGDTAELPAQSAPVVDIHLPGVQAVAATYPVDARVRRNEFIPRVNTGGIRVVGLSATDLDLLSTTHGTLVAGRFLTSADLRLPMTVLGATAARRLGVVTDLGRVVNISGVDFVVIGILERFERLNTNFNTSALIGLPVAMDLFDADDSPDALYVRVIPEHLVAVRDVLPFQINPESPASVAVSRPSDALEAREIIDDTFRSLLIGLAGIGALIGAIGIANVMVISVMERRGEIGLRRALGATRRHIMAQFLVESVLLALVGGSLGLMIGIYAAMLYSRSRGWEVTIPLELVAMGLGFVAVLGALAGLYPAIRAARMAPADAVRAGI